MNSEAIKNLSTFLTKNLKDKEIKQSLLLEVLAKYEGYKDWNTLVGIENKNKNKDLSEEGWSRKLYIYIDNGGYSISYNKTKKMLKIESTFYGYSGNLHLFNFTKKDLLDFISEGKKWSHFIKNKENEPYQRTTFFPNKDNHFYFCCFNVVFKNQYSTVFLDAFLTYNRIIKNIDIFD